MQNWKAPGGSVLWRDGLFANTSLTFALHEILY
jgi:hypothetical protein